MGAALLDVAVQCKLYSASSPGPQGARYAPRKPVAGECRIRCGNLHAAGLAIGEVQGGGPRAERPTLFPEDALGRELEEQQRFMML